MNFFQPGVAPNGVNPSLLSRGSNQRAQSDLRNGGRMVAMAQNNNSLLQDRNFPSHGHSGIAQALSNSTGK